MLHLQGLSVTQWACQLIFHHLSPPQTIPFSIICENSRENTSSTTYLCQQCSMWQTGMVHQACKCSLQCIHAGICGMGPNNSTGECNDLHVDTCLGGMALWYPEVRLGYQCCIPSSSCMPIFYWEAVAVACAMISLLTPRRSWLVVYTDNLNTADIWHTLKASAPYNTIFILPHQNSM